MRIGRGSMGRLAIAAMLAGVGIAHPAAAQKTLLILGEACPRASIMTAPLEIIPHRRPAFTI